jgi:hypothetical protein
VFPARTEEAADCAIATSALADTGVEPVATSSAGVGSDCADDSTNVFWIGSGVVYDAGTD